ncbi:hypothetical protein, partial [Alistipes putredinis]|uniref:hypothetical protein n=1 Tax=Alistipes putredinis TaxID=28117 RepID=UPI003FD86EDC
MGAGITFRKKYHAFGGSRWIHECFRGFATFFVDFVDSPSDDIYVVVYIQKTDQLIDPKRQRDILSIHT